MEPPIGRQRTRVPSAAKAASFGPPEPHPYKGIIEDVIRNSRDHFIEEGIDEQLLAQLQFIWETRLSAVLNPDAAASAIASDPLQQQLAEDPASRGIKGTDDGGPPSKRQGLSKDDSSKPEKLPQTEGAEREEEELGSDLDESEEQAPETDNLVLCQYEKVTRHKTKTGNRFKCVLKDGVMTLGGKEILFHKGSGDAED